MFLIYKLERQFSVIDLINRYCVHGRYFQITASVHVDIVTIDHVVFLFEIL